MTIQRDKYYEYKNDYITELETELNKLNIIISDNNDTINLLKCKNDELENEMYRFKAKFWFGKENHEDFDYLAKELSYDNLNS